MTRRQERQVGPGQMQRGGTRLAPMTGRDVEGTRVHSRQDGQFGQQVGERFLFHLHPSILSGTHHKVGLGPAAAVQKRKDIRSTIGHMHEERRGAGWADRLDAPTPDVGFFAALASLRTRLAFGRRLPHKGLLMSTSKAMMRCRINRQDGLQEQATTAIIAHRSQTGGLGMMSVIEVRGL